MTKEIMKQRLKDYALSVARLVLKLSYHVVNKNYGDQVIRSSSSSAVNYRAALRAKSAADFLNKFKIVEEELDESIFFLEMIEEINPEFSNQIQGLHKEGNELLAIIVASLKTLRRQQNRKS
jgi:four helix bundle protein